MIQFHHPNCSRPVSSRLENLDFVVRAMSLLFAIKDRFNRRALRFFSANTASIALGRQLLIKPDQPSWY
jgi:hypothetical protein